MKIQYNGSSKILKRLVELVNRSQNVALRQDNTDKNTLYWTGLDGVEITVNIPSGAVKVDTELSETSTNPVENQAITKELAQKADKSVIPTVGDGVLSVQRNGKSVGTFSANAAENEAINIPVPEKVSELENDAGYGTYTKPTTGIPKSDLASGVQASLGKADTALQKHQDISGKLDKTGDASTTTVAFSAASARENVKTGEKLSVIVGKIAKWFADLKTVAFTGSYNDLANKPTIPDGSKYLPLSGGAMVGDIDMQTNKRDILVGTQKASYNNGTPIVGGIINTDKKFVDMLPTMRSYIGTYQYKTSSQDLWYDLISVRHRNGYSDGSHWGMSIFAPLFGGNLRWNLNTNKDVWQGERTLLDSVNYTSYALAKDGTAKKADCLSTGQLKFGYIYNGTSTATAEKTWARVAYCVVPKGYTTITMAMLVTCGNSGVGLFDIAFRNNVNCDGFEYFVIKQIITNFPEKVSINDIKAFAKSTSDGMQYEIWYNIKAIYGTRQFTCLAEQLYGGENSNEWKFENHTSADFKASPPTDGTEATYKNCGVVSTAETLTDSGWVATTRSTTFTTTSTVKCRKYGQLVEVRGEVTFNSTYGSPTVCTLPAGYRPATVVQACGITPSGKQYMIKADTSGVISFGSDSGSTFVNGTTYRVDLTYLLG